MCNIIDFRGASKCLVVSNLLFVVKVTKTFESQVYRLPFTVYVYEIIAAFDTWKTRSQVCEVTDMKSLKKLKKLSILSMELYYEYKQ